jgi:hypothetical protein
MCSFQNVSSRFISVATSRTTNASKDEIDRTKNSGSLQLSHVAGRDTVARHGPKPSPVARDVGATASCARCSNSVTGNSPVKSEAASVMGVRRTPGRLSSATAMRSRRPRRERNRSGSHPAESRDAAQGGGASCEHCPDRHTFLVGRFDGQVVSRKALAREVWKESGRTAPLDDLFRLTNPCRGRCGRRLPQLQSLWSDGCLRTYERNGASSQR